MCTLVVSAACAPTPNATVDAGSAGCVSTVFTIDAGTPTCADGLNCFEDLLGGEHEGRCTAPCDDDAACAPQVCFREGLLGLPVSTCADAAAEGDACAYESDDAFEMRRSCAAGLLCVVPFSDTVVTESCRRPCENGDSSDCSADSVCAEDGCVVAGVRETACLVPGVDVAVCFEPSTSVPGSACRDDSNCGTGGVCGVGHHCISRGCANDAACGPSSTCVEYQRDGASCGSGCESRAAAGASCIVDESLGCTGALACVDDLVCDATSATCVAP
ncbi:MAG TPA: hypothetical protein VGO62_16935 [Myxococcota bacterium]